MPRVHHRRRTRARPRPLPLAKADQRRPKPGGGRGRIASGGPRTSPRLGSVSTSGPHRREVPRKWDTGRLPPNSTTRHLPGRDEADGSWRPPSIHPQLDQEAETGGWRTEPNRQNRPGRPREKRIEHPAGVSRGTGGGDQGAPRTRRVRSVWGGASPRTPKGNRGDQPPWPGPVRTPKDRKSLETRLVTGGSICRRNGNATSITGW